MRSAYDPTRPPLRRRAANVVAPIAIGVVGLLVVYDDQIWDAVTPDPPTPALEIDFLSADYGTWQPSIFAGRSNTTYTEYTVVLNLTNLDEEPYTAEREEWRATFRPDGSTEASLLRYPDHPDHYSKRPLTLQAGERARFEFEFGAPFDGPRTLETIRFHGKVVVELDADGREVPRDSP